MSQPKGNLKTFGFAAAICIVCSLILSGAATMLKPKQVSNIRLDIAINTLSAVGYEIPELKKMKPDKVFDIYNSEFEPLLLDKSNQKVERATLENELIDLGYPESMIKDLPTGDVVRLFNGKVKLLAKKAGRSLQDYDPGYKIVQIYKKEGNVDAYVIPIDGYGLWDMIYGYIALEPDLNTVKGISFYEHKETPGLGARITEDWFKDNYKGKKILDDKGNLVSITVVKGKARDAVSSDKLVHSVDGISGATLTGTGVNDFLKEDLERYNAFFESLRKR